jgi:hypothetical protein
VSKHVFASAEMTLKFSVATSAIPCNHLRARFLMLLIMHIIYFISREKCRMRLLRLAPTSEK